MCGLTGLCYHDRDRTPDAALLSRMAATIVHRGPDDEGILTRDGLGVAFRRLSIIDVSGGHQPIWNEEKNVAVVCNGEIYNFRELRRELEAKGHQFRSGSDVETVVHLYEEHGKALLEKLCGMYAICVFDFRGARPKVLLARDRIGIKPMYWAETEEGLAFGSETKTLLASGLVDRRVRGSALLDYLTQGYISGENSIWNGIRRLPPGSTLEWTPGEPARVERYWDLPLDGPREPATTEEVLEWVDRVVEDRLVADVPLGAFLSGGIDSTAVVTSMASLMGSPIACSVGFHEKTHDELETARATAARLSATHFTEVLEPDPGLAVDVLPWHFDEPLADPSTVPTFLVSKMAREHVTVALSGDGGDEIFAGYRRYVFDLAENRMRRRVGSVGRWALGAAGRLYPKLDWAPRFLRAKHVLSNFAVDPCRAYFDSLHPTRVETVREWLAPDLRAALSRHDPLLAFQEHYDRPTFDDSLYRAQYADFHTFLPDQILVKTDRASMANSLEVRVPLLDHRFVERFCTLPASEKIRQGRGKHAFREALRGRVPDSVLDGQKRGFDTPLRAWIRGPLAGPVNDALEALPETWFDRAALRRMMAEHKSGRRDHSFPLWTLFVLEHWRRRHSAGEIAA